MLTSETILLILSVIIGYALLSRRLDATVITLPMVFTTLGLLIGALGLELVPMGAEHEIIHIVADATLILVLFSDASQVKFRSLVSDVAIPARMLLIGMPLTIAFGTVIAKWVSPEQPWALALLVAAILTPTDAALGQAVVSNPAVPERLRQGINVESGLNDGLALPVVLIAAILAADAAGVDGEGVPDNIAVFAVLQVTIGPLAGILMGYLAAELLDAAIRARTVTTVFQGIFFLCTAFLMFLCAEAFGGNGLIAAFVGGLVFGNTLKAPSEFIGEFMESEGRLFTIFTFLVFGAVLAPVGLDHASWWSLTLAILFLSIVRMAPIALSLAGTGLSAYEKICLGWFGPRGLASILFALLVLERFPIPGAEELAACVVLTVLISVYAHGMTAAPMVRRFARLDATR